MKGKFALFLLVSEDGEHRSAQTWSLTDRQKFAIWGVSARHEAQYKYLQRKTYAEGHSVTSYRCLHKITFSGVKSR